MISTEKGKKELNRIEEVAPICQGSRADLVC